MRLAAQARASHHRLTYHVPRDCYSWVLPLRVRTRGLRARCCWRSFFFFVPWRCAELVGGAVCAYARRAGVEGELGSGVPVLRGGRVWVTWLLWRLGFGSGFGTGRLREEVCVWPGVVGGELVWGRWRGAGLSGRRGMKAVPCAIPVLPQYFPGDHLWPMQPTGAWQFTSFGRLCSWLVHLSPSCRFTHKPSPP